MGGKLVEYAVLITRESDSLWRAAVQGLPGCKAEAETRDQVITAIKACLDELMRHTEVIRVEAPAPTMGTQNLNGVAGYTTFEQAWPDFGVFRDDPTLDELFDDIERRRDARLTSA
jgi:predicted RNase H-like HicB family nuclease